MKSLHMALAAGAVAAAAVLAFVLNWKPKLAVAPLTSDEVRKNVQGKSFLIVGGTKGIGAALGRALVENDARVTVTGRKRVKGETPDGAEFIESDLSTVRASRNLVRNLLKDRRFDTVVLTVGIITRPELTRTADGIEEDLAISYLSRFIITNELIRANMLEGRKRIFIMGFPGQKLEPINLDDINFKTTPYSQWGAHMNTVIFNEALQLELAEKHPNLRIFGLNPGLIQTGIRDNFHGGKSSFLGRVLESAIALTNVSPDQYARDVLLPLMASPELESKTSLSFSQKGEQLDTPVLLQSKSIRHKIWNESQLLVNQADPENAVVY